MPELDNAQLERLLLAERYGTAPRRKAVAPCVKSDLGESCATHDSPMYYGGTFCRKRLRAIS